MSKENQSSPAAGKGEQGASELDSLRAKLSKLEARVQAMEGRDSTIVGRVDELENRIEAIEADSPATLRAAIQELDGRMKRRMTKVAEAQTQAMRHSK